MRLRIESGRSPHPSRPGAVMILVLGVWAFVRAVLVNSAAVSLENVVLRHQLAVLQRSVGRPRLRRRDPLFWGGPSPPAFLSRRVIGVASNLVLKVDHPSWSQRRCPQLP